MAEKRRQRRNYCRSKIHYVKWEDGKKADIEMARCSDVGPTGMCIYSSSALKPGAILKVSEPNDDTLSRVATVRWVEKLDWNLFRAGLAFL